MTGQESEPALVTIHCALYHPIAYDDECWSYGGAETGGNVLDNDLWCNAAELVSGPSSGSLEFNSDGSFSYTPNPGFDGTDTFEYMAVDTVTQLESDPAIVTIYSIQYDPLTLDRSAIESDGATLNMDDLAPLAREAVRRWQAAGVGDETVAALLSGLQFVIADLPGSDLAGATGNGAIVVDVNAAGYGWFIDASSGDDAEFLRIVSLSQREAVSGRALAQADLLTALMHEIGHELGLDHDYFAQTGDSTNLMNETLGLGVRRNPTVWDAAVVEYLFSQRNRRSA